MDTNQLTQQEEPSSDPFVEVTILDADTKEFTSKTGREFFVHSNLDSFPIARYEQWERMSVELGFARSFTDIYDTVGNAIDLIMDNNKKEAIVDLSNLQYGMSRVTNDRHTIVMYMCSLFIYEKGEDPFTWTIDIANSKIECWQQEYASGFFLALAIGLVNGYRERFRSTIQEFSSLSKLSQDLQTELENLEE